MRREKSPNADDLPEWEDVNTAADVIETLVRIRDEDGLEDLLADVQFLLAGIPDAVEKVQNIIRETPEEAKDRIIHEAERASLPVLVRVSIDVDYRAVVLPDSSLKLLPITIVRLEFDELICGSDAVVFQVTDDRLVDIVRLARKGKQIRRDIEASVAKEIILDASVLPPVEEA